MARITAWIEAFALSVGGPGLFVIAFLDSSFLSFPEVNDLLIVLPLLISACKDLAARFGAEPRYATTLPDVIVPISYNFPHSGKLLSASFVLFAGWFALSIVMNALGYWNVGNVAHGEDTGVDVPHAAELLEFAEAVERHAAQVSRGDNSIGINIVQQQRHGRSGNSFDLLHGLLCGIEVKEVERRTA